MSELTDDQLDELFRKSAEEFDPPFDPAAWQDMKARLDTTDHTMPAGAFLWKKLLRWGLPVVLLLLLTGGGWFVYRKTTNAKRNALSSRVVSQQPEGNTAAKGSHPLESSRLADTEQLKESLDSSTELQTSEAQPSINREESRTETVILEKPVANVALRVPKAHASETHTATKSGLHAYKLTDKPDKISHEPRNVATAAGNTKKVTSGRSGTQTTSLLVQQQGREVRRRRSNSFRGINNVANVSLVLNDQSGIRRDFDNVALRNEMPRSATLSESIDAVSDAPQILVFDRMASRPPRWAEPLTFTGRAVEVQPDTTARKSVPNVPVQRGLSVRFVVAPDLSGVGLKNFSRPGTNVGLMLEYRLASRWSFQAGVIQSTKVYKASPSEYGYLPDYLQKYKSNLAGVDGRCSMFDIPINIRYDVVMKPRENGTQPTRWFISSGLTSYIMNREDYAYTYYHYYSTNIPSQSASTGGYGLSHLNLSVGYERALSRRLSWQVEPFMKAPLKGVGYFKINLLSTGAFFSIRYKL
ncbi:hypothetical protein GCM10028807_05200 [Spirosoma daeguense]